MAGITNTGVINYVSNPIVTFPKNSITIDIFGNVFYRDYAFGAGDDTGVYWNSNTTYTKESMLFFAVAMSKALEGKYSYGKKLRSSQSLNFKMRLPVKDGKIDFDFISSFIAGFEIERLKKLEIYLISNRLDNYVLTDNERYALKRFDTQHTKWVKHKIGDLFERVSTKKLSYQAKELPVSPNGEFVLPCLTSSFKNQGLNCYAPKGDATILKNVISIPSNSDVYRAYFQSNEFTVLSDAYAIRWKEDSMQISQNQYLFMVMCINKVTDLPIYSYKNKLGGWNVVKNKYIQLPMKDNEIDFEFMETFISAIKKLAIKNVVLYTKEKIESYNKNVNKVDL